MARHHRWRWSASTTLTLRIATATTVVSTWLSALLRRAIATTGATRARHITRAVLATTRSWCWALARATRREWVVGYTRRTAAWLRTGLRPWLRTATWLGPWLRGVTRAGSCAWLRLRSSTRLRSSAWLWRWSWLWRCTRLHGGGRCGGCLSHHRVRRLRAWLRSWTGRRCLWRWLRGRGRFCRLLCGSGLLAHAVMLLHLLYDRRLHSGRRGLHKFALLLERGEKFLAGHTELFCELVNT